MGDSCVIWRFCNIRSFLSSAAFIQQQIRWRHFWRIEVRKSCLLFYNPSLQCRRILGSDPAHFDQASAILDSNSEEAWVETKRCPREWLLG